MISKLPHSEKAVRLSACTERDWPPMRSDIAAITPWHIARTEYSAGELDLERIVG